MSLFSVYHRHYLSLRDNPLDFLEAMFEGKHKAPDLLDLQSRVAGLDQDSKNIVRQLVEEVITTGMHDLLFAVQEHYDNDESVDILINGKSVPQDSDGLHGEIFTNEGWMARFSKYPVKEED